jgi:hypothetical protein
MRRLKHRTRESMLLLILQLVATGLHVDPQLVYARPGARTTTRLVAYLAELGPVWVLTFGATSLLLTVSLLKMRAVWMAHLLCATVWVFYAAGLWIGALLDTPHGTVFFPSVATAVATMHVILGVSYSDDDSGVTR